MAVPLNLDKILLYTLMSCSKNYQYIIKSEGVYIRLQSIY